MSEPNIPDINPQIDLTTDDSLKLILSSIGMEELSLSHILNAEAEKVQYSLGTLKTSETPLEMPEIIKMNKSANRMVKDSLKSGILLDMKLNETSEFEDERRKIKIDSTDDYIKIIENAPNNSVITFSEGEFDFSKEIVIDKKLTLKGIVKEDNKETTIKLNNATFNVQSSLTLEGFTIIQNNDIGIPGIAVTKDDAVLKIKEVRAKIIVDRNGQSQNFEDETTFLQITNIVGTRAGGSPQNIEISLQNIYVFFNAFDAKTESPFVGIGYAGSSSGKLYIDNLTAYYIDHYSSYKSLASRIIEINQDKPSELQVEINNSRFSYCYIGFYINCPIGKVSLTVNNFEFMGYTSFYFEGLTGSNVKIINSTLNGIFELSANIVLNNVKDSAIEINNTLIFYDTIAREFHAINRFGLFENSKIGLLGNSRIEAYTYGQPISDYIAFNNLTKEQVLIDESVTFDPPDIKRFSD